MEQPMENSFRLKCTATGKTYTLKGNSAVIGRGDDCDIRIRKSDLSRKHAEIRVEGATVTLRDLGSKNGTRLNKAPVAGAVMLNHGDIIYMGANTYTALMPMMTETSSAVEHQSFLVEEMDGEKTALLGKYPKPPGWSEEDEEHFSPDKK
jgi:predicted component of type VI protein secretion system